MLGLQVIHRILTSQKGDKQKQMPKTAKVYTQHCA